MIQQFHVKAEVVATCPDCGAKTNIDYDKFKFTTYVNCIGCDAELVLTGIK